MGVVGVAVVNSVEWHALCNHQRYTFRMITRTPTVNFVHYVLAINIISHSLRCYRYRLEVIGAIVTFATAFFVWLDFTNSMTAGIAGFAMVWASNYTVGMNHNVTSNAQLQGKLTSVQRVMAYSNFETEDDELVQVVRLSS